MRNTKKVIVTSVIAMIVLVCSVANFIQINQQYPSVEVIEHAMNDVIKGGNTSLVVKEYRFFDGEELAIVMPDYQELVLDDDGGELDDDEIRVLMVNINLINNTSEHQTMSLAQIYAQSHIWSNGIPLELFEMLNPNKGNPLGVPLAPNEELEVVVPYLMYSVQFTKRDWSHIDNRKFDLSLSLYPIKHVVKLY